MTSERLVKTGLTIAAVAAGLYVLGRYVFATQVPFVLILAVVLAFFACRELLIRLRTPARRAAPVREDVEAPILGLLPDRPFAGARRWEYLLDGTRDQPDLFARTVRPELAALVDERLRLSHRFTRQSDPDRARAVLGQHLFDLLASEQSTKALTQAELDDVLDEMEKLWATPR